ncbi:MAG: bifunctional riboflavin kinase/FAD synthetase [Oligoflexus sp.]
MKVFRNIEDLQAAVSISKQHIVTIGNFDGCHLGHQSLIKKTLELAQETKSNSLCLTFHPHPKYFFHPEQTPAQLFTREQKIQAFTELGLDKMLIQSFDQPFRETTATEFYQRFLRKDLRAQGIVIGHNFHFGKDRQGSPSFLQEMAEKDSVHLHIMSPHIYENSPISSTRIRQVLQETGQVDQAWSMLGRPYCLLAKIGVGQQIGRQIGFPTINLKAIEQAIPCKGVYAALVWLEGLSSANPQLMQPELRRLLPAVVNVGYRPTLQDDDQIVVEAHLLNDHTKLHEDLSQQKIAVYFLSRIRDERRFAGAEELKEQIQLDILTAKQQIESLVEKK